MPHEFPVMDLLQHNVYSGVNGKMLKMNRKHDKKKEKSKQNNNYEKINWSSEIIVIPHSWSFPVLPVRDYSLSLLV